MRGGFMKNDLFTINSYGQITIDIKTHMDAKGITRNALARAVNTRFEVIKKWYGGHVEKSMPTCLFPLGSALSWNVHPAILFITKPVPNKYLGIWERGKRIPVVDNLVVLATLYNEKTEDVLAYSTTGEAGRLPVYKLLYLTYRSIYFNMNKIASTIISTLTLSFLLPATIFRTT